MGLIVHRVLGFKPGELKVICARQSGKSVFNSMVQQLAQPNIIEVVTSADVDNNRWYTVRLNAPTARWLRQQDRSMWAEMPGYTTSALNMFDVHEQLYTVMALKWK